MHGHVSKLAQAGLSAIAVLASRQAFAEATIPTADTDGAADNPLLKRYEGTVIVSYEKFAYHEGRARNSRVGFGATGRSDSRTERRVSTFCAVDEGERWTLCGLAGNRLAQMPSFSWLSK